VAAEDQSSVIPPFNVPPTTVQQLDPELVQSIVYTVAAEVTRQLAATLPALTSPTDGFPATRSVSATPEPAEERRLSAPPLPASSATTLVEGAIAAAHSRIAGAPQLLPTNVIPPSVSTPSNIFLSASLPTDSQISSKIKEKIWNEEFVDFGSLLSNQEQEIYQISVQNVNKH
jgi:hypothetical protein